MTNIHGNQRVYHHNAAVSVGFNVYLFLRFKKIPIFKIIKPDPKSKSKMKNLLIIRHAKSSWEAPLMDKDRPLSTRGINDAHLVSASIVDDLPKTFIIWSSTAKRAAETALIFTQNFSCPEESIVFKDDLYTFDARQLEKIVKSCNNDYDSVILFGHNEAITDFVNKFGDVYIDNVATSGFVSLQFDTNSWENIQKGKTQKVVFPKDLKN
jgi:phosphohistidine phosphatase